MELALCGDAGGAYNLIQSAATGHDDAFVYSCEGTRYFLESL